VETADPSPTGLVKVTRGKLPRVRQTHKDLMDGEDSFLVAFSSEGELKRMMDIDFHLKNHGVTLTISE
jgi:hypothetical protein